MTSLLPCIHSLIRFVIREPLLLETLRLFLVPLQQPCKLAAWYHVLLLCSAVN